MENNGCWQLVFEVWDCNGAFRRSETVNLDANCKRTQLHRARMLGREAFEDAKKNPSLNRVERLPHKFEITFSLRNPVLRYQEKLEMETA